jgi:hypothetical protein
MASVNQSTLNGRQIQAALNRGVRDTLVANGIQPASRRGKKELTLAVQRLAQQSYSTLDEATQAGQALGQKIVDLSQGKTELDGGIVRQLLITGEIPMSAKAKAKPAKTAAADVGAPETPAPAMTPAPIPEAVEPAVAEAVDETAELEPADVDLPAAGETVDAEIADAPDLDAIETLEPAHIEAPDSEPLTTTETAGTAQ